MAWASGNDPQEHNVTPYTCRHEGATYRIRDDEVVESISCVECIAMELETLKQGARAHWEIERLADEEPEYVSYHEEAYR